MPFTVKELEGFVKDLGLAEDKQKVVLEAIGSGGEKVLETLGQHILRQSDYSRQMDALNQEKTKLEGEFATRLAAEDKFRAELVNWKTGGEKKLKDAIAAREQAEQALTAVRDRIGALGTEYSIPEEEVKKILETVPARATGLETKPASGNGVDVTELRKEFVSLKDYENQIKAFAKYPQLIMGISTEHNRLFGDKAETIDWDKLIEQSYKTGKPLQAIYEETYKVAAKREELRNADVEARIAQARKEEAERVRSEIMAANPTMGMPQPNRAGSPVLEVSRKHAGSDKPPETLKGTPEQRQADTVLSAVTAFNQGKYASKASLEQRGAA